MTTQNDHVWPGFSCLTRPVVRAWPERSAYRAKGRRARNAGARITCILLGLIALAGCGGDGEPDAEPSPTRDDAAETTPSPTPEPTPEPSWPMTGLPAPDGVADRPVLVVKVDNTGNARPQAGLAAADVIVEEPVEGGLTRLAAMYHSTLPDVVVPVRSIRTTDIGLVGPTGGALVASGGAQRVLRQMDRADIPVLAEGSPGFSRDSSRPNLYSLTVDLDEVLSEVSGLGPPSLPYLEWSDAGLPEGSAITEVAIQFSGSHTTTHVWDGSAWLRDGGMTEAGNEFAASNLLILHTTTRDAGYTDPAGNPVDEVVFDAGGDALLLAGDTAVEATWTHGGDHAVFALTAASGERLTVPPGKTWIALVPERGAVTLSE